MSACSADWNERLSAYLDGETSPAENAEVDAHLPGCADCSNLLATWTGLSQRIRVAHRDADAGSASSPLLEASRRLEERILAEATRSTAQRPRSRRRLGLRVAAAVASVALVTAGAFFARPPALDPTLILEIEGQHMRAFTHGRPCEFESSDPKLVSDWIATQSNRRMEVPLLPGAELLGARRCTLKGLPAIALVYRVEGRGLTIFVPGDGTDAAASATAFADGGARCTTGRLGERICAASGASQSALAVGNDDHLVLLASTAAVDG